VAYLHIYFLNGILAVIYGLWDNVSLLASLACAACCFLYFDRVVQEQAHRGRPVRDYPRVAQWMTAVTWGLWLVASLLSSSPVPQIGALMWAALVVSLLLAPSEWPALLWRAKTFIITYALFLLVFRFYLWQTASMSPAEWAAVVGSVEQAQSVVAQNRSMATTIGFWLLWAVMPLAYFSMLIQRLTVNPMSLVSPLRSAAQIIQDVRTRGEERR
jgi:signal transduction histidine kinase